ncbi:helix-turn-helix domain-containing protein [Nocardia brevicatena]|uniref:helix-turn-helix domain-containing protein n=1 Tax=Nocardia brevicatena TaxID=37327 RepID=UPI00031BFCF8|nr:helix-turn-helix domain-containing protein [Nocardia brevicatena]
MADFSAMADPHVSEGRHQVAVLVKPPQAPFELGCAVEVFGTPRTGLPSHYDLRVCTERPGEVATTAGYGMLVPDGLSMLDTADTVLIPGWLPVDAPLAPAVRHALLRAHERGARLVSICTGAFALAQTGLLDDRIATTHWGRTAELCRRFPRIRVDPDVLYVDHGDIATSAGAGAGIDLCLHLVRTDHGAAYAARLARYMVMPPHREGGQAQYVPTPTAPTGGDSLAALLHWVLGRLDRPIGLSDMAAEAGLSPRTLARRFDEQLGIAPGRWLLIQRVTAARALLEETDLPIESIAARVGLGSATNLRRRFHTVVGTTPAAYRRTFRG